MKTIIVLICLVVSSNLYAQIALWNPIDTTDIQNRNDSAIYPDRIALFANHYGIHVLHTQYTPSDSMHATYYRLNTSGDLDTTSSIDDYGDFPNIVGDENVLYVVYRKNDTIKVQVSTDGDGTSWSLVDPRIFSNGNVNCNGVDATYSSERGLHVVWSEKVTKGYESYFNRFDGDEWVDYSPISDTLEVTLGGFPTVTTSFVSDTPRAHVTINTGNADLFINNEGKSYIRDFDYENPWSDPVAIMSGDSSKIDRLLVTEDGHIHSFYYEKPGFPAFKYRKKLVTSSDWGSVLEIDSHVTLTANIHKIQVTKTSGDTLHSFSFENGPGFMHSKKYSTSATWSGLIDVSGGGVGPQDAAVTSSSSDLFILWARGFKANTYYHFRQYDLAPLEPQNLTVEEDSSHHPFLEWNRNYEPDLDKYYIYKYINDWELFDSTTITNYQDADETYCTATPPSECTGEHNIYYYVTAVDIQSHESDSSNNVVAYVIGETSKIGIDNPDAGKIIDYSLDQNYPNPFNPSTQISYSLANDANVKVKIYDILGTEVANLVDKSQAAGSYDIIFNANNLSSGVYIYRITAISNGRILFADAKQMLLMK